MSLIKVGCRSALSLCFNLSLFITVLLVSSSALAGPGPTNMMPVALTGWNEDLVVESTAVGPPFTNYAKEMNAGEGTAHYQTGLSSYAWGLPPSGAFVSMVGDDTIFQFQPYTSSNALVLNSDTGLTNGTLTLVTPATYARLAILAHSGNGTNMTGTLTLNFVDGTSYTTYYLAPDWYNNSTNVAWFASARINLTTGADDGGTQNPRFYQTTLDLTALLGATNKPLSSLTFGKALARSTAIYAVSGLPAASSATPITLTGWNRDVVVENTASGPPYTSYAAELAPGEGTAFYQHGLPGTTNGLPASGALASEVDGTLFQFQPFTANNALVLSSDTGVSSGTLTLATPATYNSLAILANSAAGGGTPNVTLNFADGTSFTTSYYVPDWFNNSGFALSGVERINLTSGALQGAPGNPRFYQTTLDLVQLLGATNKPLASLTFQQAPAAGATAIYAVSGTLGNQTGGPVSLAAVANAPAAAVGVRSATVLGNVVSTGGDTPEVLIYYGQTDGGNNPAAWAQHSWLGPQAGSFSLSLTGLTANTTYYFTCVAINSAGTAWASLSQKFTTAAASLANVGNLPAANVTINSALLSGQILSTGGDAPAVTLYYGTANGGNNPASWANSISFGTQVGRFAQLLSGLVPNTTYYFNAEAVNAAGAAWGSVTSFTTPLTNPAAPPLVAVTTYRNDVARTGQNLSETNLTLANVNINTFGKLFSDPVDGYVVAQPLVLPNVTIPGNGVHNVVFVATEHDSVYAFDADNNNGPNAHPLWHVSFINPSAGIYTVNATADLASIAGGFVGGELGITGTPVIDPVSGTLYVVAITKEVVNNVTNFYNRLHALDVGTGVEKFSGPVAIQGTVPGVGDGNDGHGNVPFVALKHHQRSGLLLLNGNVIMSFTGHFDYPPYHGWVFGYDAYTLAQTGIFNANPNGSGGGFWESGCGPSADPQGNIYLESGNGNWDSTNSNFGDTVLKLSTTNGLVLSDWFTPYNQLALNLADIDVGSAGQVVLPDSAGSAAHPHLLLAGSKAGTIYLLDRDNMGHFNAAGDTQIVQAVSGAVGGMWCTPAWFNGSFYYIGSGDRVKQFALSNAVIKTTPLSVSPNSIGSSTPSISANGTNNAILWAMQASSPFVLHAYNATNLAQELYNSSQNLQRDNPGPPVKFTVPTVANGKVYVGAVGALAVYGNGIFLSPPIIAPNGGGVFTNSVTVSISQTFPGAAIYYTLDGSTPTTNSLLYTGPFVLTKDTGVQAVAAFPGANNSPVAQATFINNTMVGHGTGLLGQYYANTFPSNPFIGSPLVRTDAFINFNWNTVSPDPSIPTINYTVRWTGMIQPLFSETYTFYTTTDDGVRLWVNNQLVVDHWSPEAPTTWSGSINLQAFQHYVIEMDYFQAQGGAVAELQWSSPSTALAVIPQSQLYPITSLPPVYFSPSGFYSNGVFQWPISGMAGGNYIFQGSTDLLNWVPLSTNLAPSSLLNLIDPGATNYPHRFYRAIEQ